MATQKSPKSPKISDGSQKHGLGEPLTRGRIRTLLLRSLRLRCPRCGVGRLFDGWFSMYEQCPTCSLVFEREQGYFVGAIYVNYAATVSLSLAGYFALDIYTDLSLTVQLSLWGAFCVVFPLYFYRYSKSLWLMIAAVLDPNWCQLVRSSGHGDTSR
jgi:uncharacterized protein (DUF983 family)